ncbi:MAG: hypothetical protein K9N09_01465 [Candidatus Cloacimonetes bacterium]|nr:hypothetical protein [Candidatus Cloacimonadota bacterium]MCF7813267.1 hypothetical protein [Candidatus Cloacimonadota bacterium]MCF7867342.1 hypothetical protein [Candidatus Cloacimonadota bacterium]MCF7882776.1 hypothetical protein [Candidatus Cloacimonadota bacterium]
MGTQQILLIILSVVIVGVSIATGITMYKERAKEANRRAVVQDMFNVASLALAYRRTPASHGGGKVDDFISNPRKFYQFTGYPHDNTWIYTDNGQIFLIRIGSNYYVIGYGNELGINEENRISALLILDATAEDSILQFSN